MIATSTLNRDVFDFFGKWESGHSLSVLPKAKRAATRIAELWQGQLRHPGERDRHACTAEEYEPHERHAEEERCF